MFSYKEIKKTALISLWFVFLTFPIMVIKVDSIEKTVLWRWENALYIGVGIFLLRFFIEFLKDRNNKRIAAKKDTETETVSRIHAIIENPKQRNILVAVLLGAAMVFPFIFDTYQTNIMITALMYVVLGLGLNIVVGMAGLLDLGFVAFYAVGAYSYAL